MTSVGAGTSAGTGIKKAVSLMLDPYEYFTVCLLRYPTIVPFTKQQTATRSTYGGYNNYASYGYNYSSPSTTRVASDAVGSFTRAMGAGEVIGITEEWIRGNNYLKLFLQYVQHNIPLMEYNPSSNEFSNNDIACASGQVETNTNHGHGHLKSRHTPSKHSRSGAGLNSSGGVMSNKALIIQANRDFFFNMLCVYLIETAIVVRHSFAVAANAVAGLSSSANSSLSAPLVDSFTISKLD